VIATEMERLRIETESGADGGGTRAHAARPETATDAKSMPSQQPSLAEQLGVPDIHVVRGADSKDADDVVAAVQQVADAVGAQVHTTNSSTATGDTMPTTTDDAKQQEPPLQQPQKVVVQSTKTWLAKPPAGKDVRTHAFGKRRERKRNGVEESVVDDDSIWQMSMVSALDQAGKAAYGPTFRNTYRVVSWIDVSAAAAATAGSAAKLVPEEGVCVEWSGRATDWRTPLRNQPAPLKIVSRVQRALLEQMKPDYWEGREFLVFARMVVERCSSDNFADFDAWTVQTYWHAST
jgi:hypothetical protein